MKKNDILSQKKGLWLVSSCLVGLKTRYDGKIKPDESCLQFLKDKYWIPVCPEQLGGLATPRDAAEIIGGNGHDVHRGKAIVRTEAGVDVSAEFIKGANQVLQMTRQQKITGMCVKARSPSCGLHELLGVTSSLLVSIGVELKEF